MVHQCAGGKDGRSEALGELILVVVGTVEGQIVDLIGLRDGDGLSVADHLLNVFEEDRGEKQLFGITFLYLMALQELGRFNQFREKIGREGIVKEIVDGHLLGVRD